MSKSTRAAVSTVAIALACGWVSPAAAQGTDTAAVRDELATIRSEMAAMAQRIATLEGELAQAESTIDAVSAKAAEPAPAAATAKPDFEVEWKGAPKISGKGGWSFKPRGRLQYDAGSYSVPNSTGRAEGFGSELRRARLGVEGDIPGGFGYKFELDFASGAAEAADAYLSYQDGGLEVIVGQHNNFQSLEELTSSLNSSMIERAAFTDAFNFERRVGLSGQYKTGDVLVQGGLFTDNVDALSNKNWGSDGRVVYMPKMGKTQIHLGASVHYANLETGSTVRYRQRPLVHFTGERFINTGNLGANSETGFGVEGAAISGPFHVAAEGYWQKVNQPGAVADPTFFGGYAEAGIFLTGGDTRGYKGGKFDRVKPKKPVGGGGFGAVQFNVRYDYLDLNDAAIIGGKQNGYLASLIWTPTAYTRFMVNYARLEYDDAVYAAAGGDTSYAADVVGVRAQVDF
ncbi:MAG: porin [Pontixanthobacter sp.]